MSYNRHDSGSPRFRDGHERNSPGERNVEMMDLSMSTSFLSVPHSHIRKPSHTNWSETRTLRDEREKTVPVTWVRTSSAIILPPSSRSENKESFSTHVSSAAWQTSNHRDEPMGNKIERVSPANTPPSPRDVGPSVATLDLSRLNLPPNVRRALAMKYSNKKPSESATTVSNVVPNLMTSRNRFVEAKKEPRALSDRLEQPNAYHPLPGPLRAAPIRQQRSVSLDSYPTKVVPGPYERPVLIPFGDPMYSPTHSPLPKPVNVFSFAFNSKQSTMPEKTKMIDLNNAKYLPPRSSSLAKFASSNQEKEPHATHLEQHGTTESNYTSIDKEAVMSKLTIPGLRSRMRTMSTERDSAYFKGDSALNPTSNIPHSTLLMSERRTHKPDQDRYIVLAPGTVTSSSDTVMYPQERIERPMVLPTKPRVLFDSKEGNGYRSSETLSRNHISEQKDREATAIALESHFRQSLNPREHAVGASKIREHGVVDLDPHRKTVSPRDFHPAAAHITVPSHKKRETPQPPPTIINDAVANNEDHSLKRKAAELHEPELKKRKGLENSTTKKPLSYLPGFEVQELLRLEHQEQSQLKSLLDVQDQIKATKLKLQALSIELENLQAKENTISKEISYTKNKRLDILQGALHRNNRPSEEGNSNEASFPSTTSSELPSAKSSEIPSTTSVQSGHYSNPRYESTTEPSPSDKDLESTSPQSHLALSKTLTDSNNETEQLSTSPPVKVKTEVVETTEPLSTCPIGETKAASSEITETYTQEDHDIEMAGNALTKDNIPTRDEQSKCTDEEHVDEHFEKSKKDFLNKIRQELNTPKKRHQMKKHRKKFSEAKISSTIAVSRDKLLLVREKMRGWKVQPDGLDSNAPSTSTDDKSSDLNGNKPSLSSKESNLSSSEVPMRDTDCISKPEKLTSKTKVASSSAKSGTKPDSKSKTKVRVVIKKGHSSEVKVNLKKKRKSTHPNKREERPASPQSVPPRTDQSIPSQTDQLIPSQTDTKNDEQCKDESEKPMNVETVSQPFSYGFFFTSLSKICLFRISRIKQRMVHSFI